MNAKHLTLICSVCSLLVGKFVAQPEWRQLSKNQLEFNASEQSAKTVKEIAQVLQRMKPGQLKLMDGGMALSTRVSAWSNSQREYGVPITQITMKLPPTGQTKISLTQIAETDPVTKLKTQSLVLKGQYASLSDFKRFLASEFSSDNAVVLDSLSLFGDNYEIGATVYSKGQ